MINQIFHRDSIVAVPWKNGGGVTREIAKLQDGSPYWRISIADVGHEGPFSLFPNLTRILTVIEGQGMTLSFSDKNIEARLHQPVKFLGDDKVIGKLPNGPIQDFNLIYDSDGYDASAEVSHFTEFEYPESRLNLRLVYCLVGSINLSDGGNLRQHSGIINPEEGLIQSGPATTILLDIKLASRR